MCLCRCKKRLVVLWGRGNKRGNGECRMTYYINPQSLQSTFPRILISHSSLDKEFCDVFVELLASIGFTERTIIYTSKPEFAVPLGADIYYYLRNHLKRDIWVFFMLSRNYYKSAACLNEMGAAWIKQSRCMSVLLPGFKHEDRKGAINLNQQTLDLCDPVRLTELLNWLKQVWRLPITSTRWTSIQYSFIEKIKTFYVAKDGE